MSAALVLVLHEEKLWDSDIAASYRSLSQFEKKLVILCITKEAVRAYLNDARAVSTDELASSLKMSTRMVAELSEELVKAGILLKCDDGFVPAKNPDTLRTYDVIFAQQGENHLIKNGELSTMKAFENELIEGRKLLSESPNNRLIKSVL